MAHYISPVEYLSIISDNSHYFKLGSADQYGTYAQYQATIKKPQRRKKTSQRRDDYLNAGPSDTYLPVEPHQRGTNTLTSQTAAQMLGNAVMQFDETAITQDQQSRKRKYCATGWSRCFCTRSEQALIALTAFAGLSYLIYWLATKDSCDLFKHQRQPHRSAVPSLVIVINIYSKT